jgi:hypothetical protein
MHPSDDVSQQSGESRFAAAVIKKWIMKKE